MSTREAAPLSVKPRSNTGTRKDPTARRQILLVVDDLSTAEVFQRALHRGGYDVTVVRDGLQALRSLARRKPDLVVLDLQVPLVPGVEVLRKLRGELPLETTPVLALTGEDTERASRRTRDCSPDGWLRKPCRTRDLVSRVRELLDDPVA